MRIFRGITFAGLILTAVPVLTAQQKPLVFGMKAASPSAAASSSIKASKAEEAAFKGQYTFAYHGALIGPSIISREISALGSIVSDGKGHITSGVEDVSSVLQTTTQVPLTGSYVLDADGNGTLTLTSVNGTKTFALFVPQLAGTIDKATVVENDDKIAGLSGTITRQKSLTTAPDGSFNLNLSGETVETSGVPNAVALAGSLNFSNGLLQGTISAFVGDGAAGTAFIIPPVSFPATFTQPDSNGRFELTFQGGAGAESPISTAQFAGYVVDAKTFNLIPITPVSEIIPLLNGSAVQ